MVFDGSARGDPLEATVEIYVRLPPVAEGFTFEPFDDDGFRH
jgi:hypothetical protein